MVLVAVAVLVSAFFAPVAYIPYADHTVCTNFGAHCQQVAQYGSLSYIYFCTGAIYETDGAYWIGTCMHFG